MISGGGGWFGRGSSPNVDFQCIDVVAPGGRVRQGSKLLGTRTLLGPMVSGGMLRGATGRCDGGVGVEDAMSMAASLLMHLIIVNIGMQWFSIAIPSHKILKSHPCA